MKNKKYKLSHTIIKGIIVTGTALLIANATTPKNIEKIPYTEEDLSNNILFNEELKEILSTDNISFSNQELYDILVLKVGEPLTKDKLDNIQELTISNKLSNNDLSDLKYLPNLLDLSINNNEVDLADITYNQKLIALTLDNCTITNSESLPNSIIGLFVYNTTCKDERFIIPYYTKSLGIITSFFNNLTLKNPSSLEYLSILGRNGLDLNCLKDCSNLTELSILRNPNVFHPEILNTLPLETITLDDYCPIWLNNEVLSTLPIDETDKLIYQEEISRLDKIAESIISPNLSLEEKICNLSIYIIDKFQYDENVLNNTEGSDELILEYNNYPIQYALNNENVICINYACLFTSLANRLNIDNYQLSSVDHTWNLVFENGIPTNYDLTNLDTESIVDIEDELYIIADMTPKELLEIGEGDLLYFYDFTPSDMLDVEYNALNYPIEEVDKPVNIGYINDDTLSKTIIKEERKLAINLKTLLTLTIYYSLSSIIDKIKKEKDKKLNLTTN